jgi:hypothetical protein
VGAVEGISGIEQLTPAVIPPPPFLERYNSSAGLELVMSESSLGIIDHSIPCISDAEAQVDIVVVDWKFVGETT